MLPARITTTFVRLGDARTSSTLLARAALELALRARPLDPKASIVLTAPDKSVAAAALLARAAVERARGAGPDGVRRVGEAGGATW